MFDQSEGTFPVLSGFASQPLSFSKAKRNVLYLFLKYHLISWPCLVVLVLSLTKFANLCVFWFGWNRTLFLLELNFISTGHYFDPLFRPLPMKDVVSAVREDERRVEKSLALFPLVMFVHKVGCQITDFAHFFEVKSALHSSLSVASFE